MKTFISAGTIKQQKQNLLLINSQAHSLRKQAIRSDEEANNDGERRKSTKCIKLFQFWAFSGGGGKGKKRAKQEIIVSYVSLEKVSTRLRLNIKQFLNFFKLQIACKLVADVLLRILAEIGFLSLFLCSRFYEKIHDEKHLFRVMSGCLATF